MQNKRLVKLLEMEAEKPQEPFVKYALALEYVRLSEYENALSYFVNLMEKHPNYVGTYYHFGQLYEQIDEPEKAREIYTKGIEIAKQEKDEHAKGELQQVLTLLDL